MSDSISRQAAIDAIISYNGVVDKSVAKRILIQLPPEQLKPTRTFVELVVEYPDPELCTYKEYKGKPYYSIKYIENGETHIGYGTYNPEILSQYLKDCFTSPALQAQDCKTCKHDPPSKKWPCIDCDMREPADRWERRTDEARRSDRTD